LDEPESEVSLPVSRSHVKQHCRRSSISLKWAAFNLRVEFSYR
jgi:hypothetical protein